jgi:2-phosphoglycolate phosphatase
MAIVSTARPMSGTARGHLRAVLFDLDGTLLDTAPDMIAAVNLLRAEHEMPPLNFASLRNFVSHGAARLVRLGFPAAAENEFPALQSRFLQIYRENLSRGTRLFEGIQAVLEQLHAWGQHIGVVTNKPAWLTEPLLDDLGLRMRLACVVSGDTLAERKPHPLPLLHAAQLAGVAPDACLYVGDAERDIQAARAAGMQSLIARYGYISPADHPEGWGADGEIAQPGELLGWLCRSGRL